MKIILLIVCIVLVAIVVIVPLLQTQKTPEVVGDAGSEVVIDKAGPDIYLGSADKDSEFEFPNLEVFKLYEEMCGEWLPSQAFEDGQELHDPRNTAGFVAEVVEQEFRFIKDGELVDTSPFIRFHEDLNAIELWNGVTVEFLTVKDGELILATSTNKQRIKSTKPQQGNFVVTWERRK